MGHNTIKRLMNEKAALESQLAEAMELLDYLHTTKGICSEFDAKIVKALLTKQKGG